MKNKYILFILTTIMIICSAFVFVACDDSSSNENDTSSGGGKTDDNYLYDVTMDTSGTLATYYQLDCYTKQAKAGDEVELKFFDTFGFINFEGVTVNGELVQADGDSCVFKMPASDATVSPVLSVADVPETQDGLKWGAVIPDVYAGTSSVASISVHFGEKEISNSKTMTVGKVRMTFASVFSTNQEVLPDDAIVQVQPLEGGASYGMATGAIIYIVGTDLTPGETTLVFVDFDNRRAITLDLTVVSQ